MALSRDLVAELIADLEREHEQLAKKYGRSSLDFLTDLSLLLFLKAAEPMGFEGEIPEGYRWSNLVKLDGQAQFDFYRTLLIALGSSGAPRIEEMFSGASSSIPNARVLGRLVALLGGIDWFDLRDDTDGPHTFADFLLGLYDAAVRRGNLRPDQQPTPTVLVNCIVERLAPDLRASVQDPACGTGGFLVGVHRYLLHHRDLWNAGEKTAAFRIGRGLSGLELSPDIYRICSVNLLLHGVRGGVARGDALSPTGAELPKADVILTNPPFGTQAGGERPSRTDLTFPTSNKQFAFLQHVYRALVPGGRAAMVVPDDVLFESGEGPKIRADLMDKCDLHTILRLPSGIWSTGATKTNVLFFRRGLDSSTANTAAVWVYDLRTNMPRFGKRTPFNASHLAPFAAAFGPDPDGMSPRTEEGEAGRWRRFTREEIRARGDSLDISWLPDENAARPDDLPEPSEISDAIIEHLETALVEMRALSGLLNGDSSDEQSTPEKWHAHPSSGADAGLGGVERTGAASPEGERKSTG